MRGSVAGKSSIDNRTGSVVKWRQLEAGYEGVHRDTEYARRSHADPDCRNRYRGLDRATCRSTDWARPCFHRGTPARICAFRELGAIGAGNGGWLHAYRSSDWSLQYSYRRMAGGEERAVVLSIPSSISQIATRAA